MNYIERNKDVGFGQPIIIGTRLTVFNVVFNAYHSKEMISFLKDFDLNMEELKSAIDYCKNRECKKMDADFEHYCHGCILRSISEGWQSSANDFYDSNSIAISRDKESFALTSIDDMDDDDFGVMGWLIAEELERMLPR